MARSEASDPMLPLGTNRCKCAKCGRYFSAITSFDIHQRTGTDGRVICRDPETVGLVQGKTGHWQKPGDPEGALLAFRERRDATEGAGVVAGDLLPQRPLF